MPGLVFAGVVTILVAVMAAPDQVLPILAIAVGLMASLGLARGLHNRVRPVPARPFGRTGRSAR